MYELTSASRNSPPFFASNVDDLSSVGIDHFINPEDIAGPVAAPAAMAPHWMVNELPNIDVQIEGRTSTAFGGNVFAIAPGPISNMNTHGVATGVIHADYLKSDDLTGTPNEDVTAFGSAVTVATAWSNTQPNATARFTILKRVL